MWKVSTGQWITFAHWSAVAFIAAGVLGLGNLTLSVLGTHTEMARQEWALDLTLSLTYGVTFVALLGVYPWLANCTPRLSCTALGAVAVAAIGVTALFVAKYVPIGVESPSDVLQTLFLLASVCIPLSFLLFSVACLRTDVFSRRIGLFLLVAAIARFVSLGGMLGQMDALLTIGGGLFAVGLLVIGYLLYVDPPPAKPSTR